ncbi:hypothetical protein ACFQ0G_22690 [Streptomyces chiangmaiensis]
MEDATPHACHRIRGSSARTTARPPIAFADGNRWSGTVFTLDGVQCLMNRWNGRGECLGGSHFHCWDGLIVRDAGILARRAFRTGTRRARRLCQWAAL